MKKELRVKRAKFKYQGFTTLGVVEAEHQRLRRLFKKFVKNKTHLWPENAIYNGIIKEFLNWVDEQP